MSALHDKGQVLRYENARLVVGLHRKKWLRMARFLAVQTNVSCFQSRAANLDGERAKYRHTIM